MCLDMAEDYLKINKPKEGFAFFEKAASKGAKLNRIENQYKQCDTTKYAANWKQFIEGTYLKARKVHLKTLDIDLYTQILTIEALDNYVRIQYLENSKRDSALLWQLMDKVDIVTLKSVLDIIKSNKGYPSMKQIGDASDEFYLLLLHTIDDEKEELALMPTFIKAIENGDLHPNQVAYLRDYHEQARTKTQIYGTINPRWAIVPIVDIQNVDKRRQELGLPTLEKSYAQYKWTLPKGYKVPDKKDYYNCTKP